MNTISLSRGKDIVILEKYLYDNSSIYLERKRDSFMKAIAYINGF